MEWVMMLKERERHDEADTSCAAINEQRSS